MSSQIETAKRFFGLILGLWIAAAGISHAAPNPKRQPGKVVVAKVTGKVEAVDPGSRKTQLLRESDVISEKFTVIVGTASATTLVFSNGAIINLLENTTLVITQFLQDPFSSPYSTAVSSEEPTTSVTRLNLVKGEMVGSVKKLRTDEGSSLIVNTPVGASGVRGTIFAVSYVPDTTGTGKAKYILSVTEGEVELTDSNGNKKTVSAGQEVVITVQLSVDPVTGETSVTEVLSMDFQDIPQERQDMIDGVAEDGSVAAQMIFVDLLEVYLFDVFHQGKDAPVVTINPKDMTETDP